MKMMLFWKILLWCSLIYDRFSVEVIARETRCYCYDASECGTACTTGWNDKSSIQACNQCCKLKNGDCRTSTVKIQGQEHFYLSWPTLSSLSGSAGLSFQVKCPYEVSANESMRLFCSNDSNRTKEKGVLILVDYCTYDATEILNHILQDVNSTGLNTNHAQNIIAKIQHFYRVVVYSKFIGKRLLQAIDRILHEENNLNETTREEADFLRMKINIAMKISSMKKQKFTDLKPNRFGTKDLRATVDTLEKITNQEETTEQTQSAIWDVVDQMFNVSRDVMKESEDKHLTSTRLLKIVTKTARKLADSSISKSISRDNFAVSAISIHNSLHPPDLSIVSTKTGDSINNYFNFNSTNASTIVADCDVLFKIPQSLFEMISTESEETGKNITILSIVYKNDHLFSESDDSNAEGHEKFRSLIFSTEIYGYTVRDLQTPIEMTFNLGESDTVSESCVYWNVKHKNWSTDGLTLASHKDGQVKCLSNHLTNFAVLFNAKPLDNIDGDILNMITYIGLGISLAGALLTFVTYLAFPALRKNTPPRILMNLCLSLILMHIIFLIGVERGEKSKAACQTMSFLLHYSFLTIFAWNLVEGFHSVRGIAAPMKVEISRFLLKSSIFAWGFPLVITAVGFGVWPDNYSSPDSCVVSGYPFYAVLLTPIIFVIFSNIIALFAIMRSLISTPGKDSVNILRFHERLRIAVVFMVLFGVTWIFGLFVINNGTIAFQYLFCILSSLQGLYIMIAYCVRNQKIRSYWLAILRCQNLNHVRRMSSTVLKNKGAFTIDTTTGHSMSEAHHKINSTKR